jgi:hypothetical protein
LRHAKGKPQATHNFVGKSLLRTVLLSFFIPYQQTISTIVKKEYKNTGGVLFSDKKNVYLQRVNTQYGNILSKSSKNLKIL